MLVRLQFGNSSHTTALLPGTVVVVLLARALLLLLLALRLPEYCTREEVFLGETLKTRSILFSILLKASKMYYTNLS